MNNDDDDVMITQNVTDIVSMLFVYESIVLLVTNECEVVKELFEDAVLSPVNELSVIQL